MSAGFQDLSRERCIELIATATVGRVAYCVPSGPRIYPINFVLDGESVVFRTAPYTALGAEIDGRPVTFEVDQLDSSAESGWSVVVAGIAQAIEDPDEVARLRRTSDPTPLAAGTRPLYVRIPSRRISGRAVGRTSGLDQLT